MTHSPSDYDPQRSIVLRKKMSVVHALSSAKPKESLKPLILEGAEKEQPERRSGDGSDQEPEKA